VFQGLKAQLQKRPFALPKLQTRLFRHSNNFFKNQNFQQVKSLSYRTESASKHTVEHKWYVIDAEGMVLGRLCSQIAHILRGKHRPDYTPHTDCGDYVIVLNADKVRLTGRKIEQKEYQTFSGYPGGRKVTVAKNQVARHPTSLITIAVKGMLPHTKLGNAMFKKLFAYTGTEHGHAAQKPEPLVFKY
jgi:large subunit ribosomal protein L13